MKTIKLNRIVVVSAMFLFVAHASFAGQKAGPSETQRLLALAKAATAQYHDVNVALADGYLPAEYCVPGMGYHFYKPEYLFIDPANGDYGPDVLVSETQPEILLYEDAPNGGLRLVGVEYFAADLDQDHPFLFVNQYFDGPMDGLEEGIGAHYDLHVWLWKNNPDGLFAPFNPRVTCY